MTQETCRTWLWIIVALAALLLLIGMVIAGAHLTRATRLTEVDVAALLTGAEEVDSGKVYEVANERGLLIRPLPTRFAGHVGKLEYRQRFTGGELMANEGFVWARFGEHDWVAIERLYDQRILAKEIRHE